MCNSYFQQDCGDWFDNRTFNLDFCEPGVTMCRKMVQEGAYDYEIDCKSNEIYIVTTCTTFLNCITLQKPA